MPIFARVRNGVVIGREVADAAGGELVEIPDGVFVDLDWRWDGQAFARGPRFPSLAAAKSARKAEVERERDRRIALGTTVSLTQTGGGTFPVLTDPGHQIILMGLVYGARLALLAQQSFTKDFVDADDATHALTAAQYDELGREIEGFLDGLYAAGNAHKAAIQAIDDADETAAILAVEDYDITIGWE